jgi:hypothetical protein
MPMKNSNDTIGNRTRDLPACSSVSQNIALEIWYTAEPDFIVVTKRGMPTEPRLLSPCLPLPCHAYDLVCGIVHVARSVTSYL